MTVIELMARLNGEILSNKARAMVDGKIVILARMIDGGWVYTAEGQALANEHSNEVVAEATAPRARKTKDIAPKAPRARKAKDVPTKPVAIESADVEPKL